MSRRFQFSLTSLLVATAVVAATVNWWTLRQRAVAAQQRFDEEKARWSIGVTTSASLIRASKELLQAELAVPFVPSDHVAWLSYLDRTRGMFRSQHAHANLAMFASEEAWRDAQDLAEQLLKECQAVEDRLGLPHVDNNYFHLRRDGSNHDTADDDSQSNDEIAPPAPDDAVSAQDDLE